MGLEILTPQEAAERLARMDEVVAAVRIMREHQRAWFGGDKSRERLQASKSAERLVDKLLAGLAARDAVAAQPSLFGGR